MIHIIYIKDTQIFFKNSFRMYEENIKENYIHVVSLYVIKTENILYVKKKLIFFWTKNINFQTFFKD